MGNNVFTYRMIILETYLDLFGHVNNAAYLVLYEQARWDLITRRGYGLKEIMERKIGPTILDLKLTFLKELRARDEIIIETELLSYEGKVGKMLQKMVRGGEICSTLELSFGLFDLNQRKLIVPPPEWLTAVGMQ